MSVRGPAAGIAGFVAELARAPPPLARIDAIERTPSGIPPDGSDFRIVAEPRCRNPHRCRAGCRDLSSLPRRDFRPGNPPLPLSVHQLHALRPAPVDHPGDPLRPFQHHDERVPHVRCLRGGVRVQPIAGSTPSRSPARNAVLVCGCSRSAPATRSKPHGSPAVRAYRGDQGTGRRTPRLRRHQCQRRRTPARGETARCKTVRPHGQRSRRDHALCRGNVGGICRPGQHRCADRCAERAEA